LTANLEIPTARAFLPLLSPARYKGAHGGRGSGKSWFFAELLVEECLLHPGTKAVCIREIQKTLSQSSKAIVETKIEKLGVSKDFEIQRDQIKTPGGGLIIFQGMQDHTAESIKSLEGYRIAWVEEAQTLSARSLNLLRPTIRVDNSEIWFSWNPTRRKDAVDAFLRQGKPDNAIVIEANWRDNPWFNATLEAERQLELSKYPERYGHTYEGEYAAAFEGAYFAGCLNQAKLDGRICTVSADPLLPLRAFVDIGGAGAKADAFVIWICQFVGQEIRVLNYYEAQGQVLAEHVAWLRQHGYEKAIVHLPHDGVNVNNITGKTYWQHLKDAGLDVPLPTQNQGAGAASLRIEAVRRVFPKIWFNAATTLDGRQALGFYHEKRDEQRNMGLGPEHDWSSHAADAFGLMAINYKEPAYSAAFDRKIIYPKSGVA
jgi:phage terminase large subunit